MAVIGVISDTHGLLRREAISALQGSDHIIHAGDIGDAAILDRLNEIAPVTAVRGNVDKGSWAQKIPENNVLEVEFRTGGVYQYFGVPRESYVALMAAMSKGRFFSTQIKPAYRCMRTE